MTDNFTLREDGQIPNVHDLRGDEDAGQKLFLLSWAAGFPSCEPGKITGCPVFDDLTPMILNSGEEDD